MLIKNMEITKVYFPPFPNCLAGGKSGFKGGRGGGLILELVFFTGCKKNFNDNFVMQNCNNQFLNVYLI